MLGAAVTPIRTANDPHGSSDLDNLIRAKITGDQARGPNGAKKVAEH